LNTSLFDEKYDYKKVSIEYLDSEFVDDDFDRKSTDKYIGIFVQQIMGI